MSNDLNELKRRCAVLSDEALLRLVFVDSADYHEEALEIAKEELRARKLDNLDEKKIKKLVGEPNSKSIQFTKEDLEDAYKKRKLGVNSKWAIKSHLESDESIYTTEAREYLISIAKQKGFSDHEVDSIIKEGALKRQRNNSWKETFFKFCFVGIVIVLTLLMLPPVFKVNSSLGVLVSVFVIIGLVSFMWKRGW